MGIRFSKRFQFKYKQKDRRKKNELSLPSYLLRTKLVSPFSFKLGKVVFHKMYSSFYFCSISQVTATVIKCRNLFLAFALKTEYFPVVKFFTCITACPMERVIPKAKVFRIKGLSIWQTLYKIVAKCL